MVQVMLELEDEDILSEPLLLRIERPRSYEEENLASDFFTDDVGRVLAFDGSRMLDRACDTLQEAATRLKTRRVAVHAHVALGTASARSSKVLDLREADSSVIRSAGAGGARLQLAPANDKVAREHLEVLTKDAQLADQTLGSTDYAYYLDQHQDLLGARPTHARILEIATDAGTTVSAPGMHRTRQPIGRRARATTRAGK
jgi:hypothetical protein